MGRAGSVEGRPKAHFSLSLVPLSSDVTRSGQHAPAWQRVSPGGCATRPDELGGGSGWDTQVDDRRRASATRPSVCTQLLHRSMHDPRMVSRQHGDLVSTTEVMSITRIRVESRSVRVPEAAGAASRPDLDLSM